MPPLQLRMAITPLCHQKRSRNDSLTQINREESSTSVSSYIQPKLVPHEGKTKPSSNNTKIALSSYKTQRKIKYDMTRETLNASLGALVYAFQNWRRGRVHSRNNFFLQKLIIDSVKETWTITRRLRYTKVFVYFVDTFLILIHWIVIYLLDNRGLKYCILHLWFFKPLPTRDSLL